MKTDFRRLVIPAAIAALYAGAAAALPIDLGNPDFSLRWDNTIRYNLGVRVEGRESQIANSATTDEGDARFGVGDIVTNRVDLLSEADLVWRNNMGVRFSGIGWYDAAYDSHSKANPNPPLSGIPSYPGDDYSGYVKRYYRGPGVELLDAFVFKKFDIADVPVSLKVGRHAVFWGESVLLNGTIHSAGYSQVPLDLQKGIATPGVEAKELFRPLNNISMQAQLTDTLSLAGQYFLEWQASRLPEGGTYLGPVDFAFDGPNRQFISSALGFASNGGEIKPHDLGDWGVALRWSPKALDATLGLYIRNYSDKLPQLLLTKVAPNASVYNTIYANHTQLVGLSFAKQVLSASFGAELSYRQHTPLNSKVLGASTSGAPEGGATPGARGDTLHGLVNLVGVVGKTPLFDAMNWIAEATWNRYLAVGSGENLFFATGYAACAGKDKWDGCTTRDYAGLSLTLTPTWYQVFPNVDLLMPLAFADGITGNSAVVLGGNQGNGNYSVGIGADIKQAYRIDLRYVDYFGHLRVNDSSVVSQNGLTSLLKDRGFVALTFKTTF